MKRLTPLVAPVLVAAFPILSLFQHNQGEIALSVIWVPLVVAVAFALVLFAIPALALKRPAAAGVLSFLGVVGFFWFGTFHDNLNGLGLGETAFLVVWAAVLVAAAVAVTRTKADLTNLTLVLGVASLVLVAIPVVKIISYRSQHPSIQVTDPRVWPTALEKPVRSSATRLPDIYYVIPDDYERPDVLKRYFGYDDSGFTGALKRRGFVMADGSRSPYSKSELNMSAALNLDYLSRFPALLGKTSDDVQLVRKTIDDSRAARFLKSLGYSYTHIDSDNITFEADNPDISRLAAPDNLTYLWLRGSVLRVFGGRIGFNGAGTDERFRQSVRMAFRRLGSIRDDPRPHFVVFHTLMPHDPYIFGPHGESVTFPDHSDTGHSTKFGMRYYVRQLRFVNQQLLRATDSILAHSRTPPVIVIQSDEGFEALEEDFGEATARDMRVKGLSALYLPGRPRPRVPRDLNTVNTFRLVFNRYFGTGFPMLRSASHPELDHAYQFEEMHVR